MTELHLAGHLHCFVMQILPFWNVHWQTVRKRLCLCHLSFLFGFRIKHIRLYLRRHSVCSFSAVKLTFPHSAIKLTVGQRKLQGACHASGEIVSFSRPHPLYQTKTAWNRSTRTFFSLKPAHRAIINTREHRKINENTMEVHLSNKL